MRIYLSIIFSLFSFFLKSQTTIEQLIPWGSQGDTSALGMMALQDQDGNYLILSNIQGFQEGSGIPIEGARTYGSGITKVSSTGELILKEVYLTTLLEWDGLVPANQFLINTEHHIVIPFAGAVGLLYCDSIGSNTAILDGFKKGVIKVNSLDGEVEQQQYFPDDLLCERDKLIALKETQNGYVLMYTDRLDKQPLYIETLSNDFEVLSLDTFNNDTRWIYFTEYDERIVLFSQHNLSTISYDGSTINSYPLNLNDTLTSPAVYMAENENYYLFGLTDFTFSQQVSRLHIIDKNSNSIQSTSYVDKLIKDVTITDNDEVLVLFDLSRNNFYDTTGKPVQVVELDIELNEVTSKNYGFPHISPETINPTNDQTGFIVTGTRLKSIDAVGGREADQIYFLKDEIEQLIVNQSLLNMPGDLQVYPNPSSGIFNIEYFTLTDKFIHLNIYNSSGQLLIARSLNPQKDTFKVNLSDWNSGMFIFHLITDEGIFSKKIIKK